MAESYFKERYRESPWTLREFVAVGAKNTSTTQIEQSQSTFRRELNQSALRGPEADRVEWKIGDYWRYAWKRPGRTGTETREIIRDELFEGVPSYVVRLGKNEYYYVKDNLGLLATMTAGKVIFKRDAPYRPLMWPLQTGKEWRTSFTLERINEKSSQTFDLRFVIANIEEITVPAGTFETFKIAGYSTYSGNLVNEFWYAPKVKWSVKERSYNEDGLLERELIGFKVD